MTYQFKVTMEAYGVDRSKIVKIASSTNDPYAACAFAEHAHPNWHWVDVQFFDRASV